MKIRRSTFHDTFWLLTITPALLWALWSRSCAIRTLDDVRPARGALKAVRS